MNSRLVRVLAAIMMMAALLSVTGCTRIGPGHVGIKIDMAGSNKGVLDTPNRTGWVWYMPGASTVEEYPTSMQTAKWTASTTEGKPVDESVTFTNKEGMAINADVSISYTLVESMVPHFYVKFMTDDLTTFTDGFLRNVARDCMNEKAGNYDVDQLMGNNAPFLHETKECIENQVHVYGVHIEQFGIIGAPRPPQVVLNNINTKVQAQQIAMQKQMELQQVQADANKQVAEAEGQAKANIARANGDAEANRIRSASITENLLKWRELDNQNTALYRWNGGMPETYVNGTGDNKLLFNIPAKK